MCFQGTSLVATSPSAFIYFGKQMNVGQPAGFHTLAYENEFVLVLKQDK